MPQTPDDFMREYERATRRHGLEATLSMIDDEAVYLFSDGSAHVGKQAIEIAIGRNFEIIRDEVYSIDNLRWLVNSEETAVCVYDFSWTGLVNGKPASGSGRGTTVLIRSGESWKVAHEHLSKGEFGG